MQDLKGNEKLIHDSIIKIEKRCPGLQVDLCHESRYFNYGVLYLLEEQLGGVDEKYLTHKRKKIANMKIDGEENPWKIKHGTLCLKKDNCFAIDDEKLKAAVKEVSKDGIAKIQLAQFKALRSLKEQPTFSTEVNKTRGMLY